MLSNATEPTGLLHHLCLSLAARYQPERRHFVWLPSPLLPLCEELLDRVPLEAFIPHQRFQEAQSTDWALQQVVMMGETPPTGMAIDTLIHQNEAPLQQPYADSVVELVLNQPQATEAARTRYRYYQSQHWPIQIINHR